MAITDGLKAGAIVLACLAVGIGGHLMLSQAESAGERACQLQIANQVAKDNAAAAQQLKLQGDKAVEDLRHANADANQARDSEDAARSQLGRLRAILAARPGARPAGASAPAGGASAASDPGVPTDVFGVLGELAVKYAGEADDRGVAGTACERSSTPLTTKQ